MQAKYHRCLFEDCDSKCWQHVQARI